MRELGIVVALVSLILTAAVVQSGRIERLSEKIEDLSIRLGVIERHVYPRR